MSVTRVLADEIVGTDPASIPDEAMDLVRAMFVDHVGIAFMGHQFTGEGLIGYARDLGGAAEALLLGTDVYAPMEIAAGVNGQLAQNAGMENTGPGLHAGPLVVHAALAVGQKTGASGADVLAAIALGYDLNARFHLARTADEDLRHLTMVGAAVAARLLRLDVDTTADALSMAWEFPMRQRLYLKPKVPKRVSAFPMGHLFTARSGIQAALMARYGYPNLADEIDQLGDEYDLDALTRRSPGYESITRGLFLKPYVASHLCHMVLQTVSELVDANEIAPGEITRVEVGLPHIYTIPHQSDPSPETFWESIYSAEWAISMVAHRVPPGPDWCTPGRLADPSSRALARRVRIVEHPPATAALARKDFLAVDGWVRLETGGRVLTGTKTMAETYGSPTTPMTSMMLEEKFLRVSEPTLGRRRAQSAWSQLSRVDECGDVRELTPVLHLSR